MSQPWILITPASRGIGHALTRHLLRTTTLPIVATARTNLPSVKASLLADLDLPASAADHRLHLLPLDVTSEPTIEAAAAAAEDLFPRSTHHLHLALAVPGILHPEKALRQVDAERALATYRVNTLGPLLLMKHFSEFLPKKRTNVDINSSGLGLAQHAVWAAMSARVGSVSDNRAGGWFSYRSSKAGVNSLAKSFDLALRLRSGDRAMALAYHPGTVRTDLSREFWGGVEEGKLFGVEFAAEKMVEVVTGKVGLEGRGRCWDWKGDEILP